MARSDESPAPDDMPISEQDERADVHWPEPSPLSGWWNRIMGPAA